MFNLKLPSDWGEVLLTSQWAGLPHAVQVLILLGVCLVPLGLILWLYRYELRLVSRLMAAGLLSLRLLVLVLMLMLVCFQPIYARTSRSDLPGRILIAVDCSDSMGIVDPQREPVEKLRLARALRLAADVCPDELLSGWIADYEKKKEPQWVKDEEVKDDPKRRPALEAQRRKLHEEVCTRVDQLTRSEAARRVLADDGLRLLSVLAVAGHKVELIGFHRDAWQVPSEKFEELFPRKDAKSAKEEKKEPAVKEPQRPEAHDSAASAYTDLRLPLVRSLERMSADPAQVLGIVLLSDGQHNTGEGPSAKARELGDRKLPIYPVALGARQPPPDAALVSIHAPPAVFKNVEAQVDVHFKVSGLKPQEVRLELHRTGKTKKLLAARTIQHDGKDRTYQETIPIEMDEVGTQGLTATVTPLDPQARETRTDNNSRTTTINVADDKARVLLVDGEVRWEYHYLATALKRDKTIQLDTVVFEQPRLDRKRSPDDLLKMGSPKEHLPAGPDALSEYDCIILGDVSPAQLPLEERLRLEKFVSDRGGTLVIVAGKRSMPLGFPEGQVDGEPDPLRKLLPIETPRVVMPRAGFPVQLTQAGRDTKFMEMDSDPSRNEAIWAGLQKHYWAVIGQAKPGATVLAASADADDKDRSERERENALFAWHHYGFGRVLYVGLDSTWRWRFKVGDLYHHTFWGAAIRWAAADKPLMSGNEFLRFGTPLPVYAREDEVNVVVRFNDALGPVKPDLLAGARLIRLGAKGEKDQSMALAPLSRREAQPRVLDGRVAGLPPGEYAVELVIPDLADKLSAPAEPGKPPVPLRSFFTIRMPDSPELIDLQTRWPLLEEIAAKSGGKVFAPEEAGQLVELLHKQSIPHVEHHDQKLWEDPSAWVLLGIVLSLLTVEWVARKMSGLP
jgi:hypothetical protein